MIVTLQSSLSYFEQGWRHEETPDGFRIEYEGGRALDYKVLDGGGSANVNLFNEHLDGAFGDARDNTLNGWNASQSMMLSGGGGNGRIFGGNDNDILSGDAGADTLNGGAGHDTLFFDAQDTYIYGGGGWGYEVAMHGGAGRDYLTGDAASDTLSGDDGDDWVYGYVGDDKIPIHGETGFEVAAYGFLILEQDTISSPTGGKPSKGLQSRLPRSCRPGNSTDPTRATHAPFHGNPPNTLRNNHRLNSRAMSMLSAQDSRFVTQ